MPAYSLLSINLQDLPLENKLTLSVLVSMYYKYSEYIRKIQLRHLFFGTVATLNYNKKFKFANFRPKMCHTKTRKRAFSDRRQNKTHTPVPRAPAARPTSPAPTPRPSGQRTTEAGRSAPRTSRHPAHGSAPDKAGRGTTRHHIRHSGQCPG